MIDSRNWQKKGIIVKNINEASVIVAGEIPAFTDQKRFDEAER